MRRGFAGLFVLVILLGGVAYAQSPKETEAAEAPSTVASAHDLIKMGNAMADLRRFDEAITAYTLALQQSPGDPTALANRALAYAWVNRLDEASKDLAIAEKVAIDDAVIHRVRAIIANRKSDQDTELEELTKSLQLEPGNPFALTFRASIYEQRGQYEAALADAEAYIAARPEEPEAYEMKADIFADQRMWQRAIAQADLIIGRFARDPRALSSAAQIYERAGRRDEALALMGRAILLDEGAFYLWQRRAGIRRWDDFAGRRLDLDTALELAPGDLGITAALGILEFDQKNWKAARDHFSEILAKDTKDFGVLAYRAMANLQLGDIAGARKDHDAAVAASSGPGDLSRICGHWAKEGIGLDWAREACDRAVQADPKRASYLSNRALVRLRTGDLKGAIEDYDRAIAADPDRASAYYGRAIAYVRLGDIARAQKDLKEATSISPTVAEGFLAYGLRDLEHLTEPAPADRT